MLIRSSNWQGQKCKHVFVSMEADGYFVDAVSANCVATPSVTPLLVVIPVIPDPIFELLTTK